MADCTENLNPLYNNYFQLFFGRGTKRMELMCQKVSLPGISIGEQPQPTTLGTTIPVPTLGIQFEPLTVEFIVDSELKNWKSLYSWIRNVTNIKDATSHNLDYEDWHHQATLNLYSATDKCSPTSIYFWHIIPISLTGMLFRSDSADALPQSATCKFKYSHYTISPDAPTNLKNSI